MKGFPLSLCFVAVAAFSSSVRAEEVSPIAKVLEMLSGLHSKIVSEGEASQKVYEEFSEWCEEQSKRLQYEVKTGKADAADLNAVIAEEKAVIEALNTKVEELSGSIAASEADLRAAVEIRGQEAADFSAEEKEGLAMIDTLARAIRILEKEMKGGASMMQLQGVKTIAQALKTMVQASVLNSADASRLTALVQDDDEDVGAPDGAVYEGQSGGIIDVLQSLLEKAKDQLNAARKTEQTGLYNFDLLKQSLKSQISTGNANLDKSKKGIAASSEKKATAEGDLSTTTKDLNADTSTLGGVHHDCMTKASDFEAETQSRDEELKALTDAKKLISEATGGALNQVSLLQIARSSSENFEVVRFVRKLAKNQHSPALAQLASRMASAVRSGSRSGGDPFEKIKGLVRDMISKLEADAEGDASHKQYCDKEMSETKVKHEDKSAEIEKLGNSIDQMSAKSAKLKEEVATLQQGLADLARSQAEMNRLRQVEHDAYVAAKAENDKGLAGIQSALKVLAEYYGKADKAHSAADGAGGGIISLLEVVESDFSKTLAELTAEEESSQAEYEQTTKANEIDNTTKEQDRKYKASEAKELDQATGESSSDRSTVGDEISAVNSYWSQLKNECIEKAEPYEEKARRRAAEIAGLKEALDILAGEAVLLQRGSGAATHMRGARRHYA